MSEGDQNRLSDIRMLATDLDGTLVGKSKDFFQYQAFRDVILRLRRDHNIAWIVCTGRSLHGLQGLLRPFAELGIQPNYVVTRDAFIYAVGNDLSMRPRLSWNWHAHRLLRRRKQAVRRAFNEWYRFLEDWDFGIIRASRNERQLSFRFEGEAAASKAAALLREKSRSFEHVEIVQNAHEVYAICEIFTKGQAVAQITSSLGMTPDQVLAVGDGRNDIGMFRSDVAKYCGCPSNARPAVMKAVSTHGGHIATAPYIAGVVQVIEAYERGTVSSELPPTWRTPRVRSAFGPEPGGLSTHARIFRAAAWTAAVLGGVVLLVLKHYGLLPF